MFKCARVKVADPCLIVSIVIYNRDMYVTVCLYIGAGSAVSTDEAINGHTSTSTTELLCGRQLDADSSHDTLHTGRLNRTLNWCRR